MTKKISNLDIVKLLEFEMLESNDELFRIELGKQGVVVDTYKGEFLIEFEMWEYAGA